MEELGRKGLGDKKRNTVILVVFSELYYGFQQALHVINSTANI